MVNLYLEYKKIEYFIKLIAIMNTNITTLKVSVIYNLFIKTNYRFFSSFILLNIL